jgi:hypothetical protein
MTKKTGLLFGAVLLALSLVTTGVGLALLVISYPMPPHTDAQRAAELTASYEQNIEKMTVEQRESIKQEMGSLRTSKWRLYNSGLSMCLVASCLILAMLYFRLWDLRNLRTVTTPQTRLVLLAIASAAWWALLPALQLTELDEYAQDDLTPHIDTGHGLMFFLAPAFSEGWAMLAIGGFFVLKNARLPANLCCWDRVRPYRSIVLTALFGLASTVFTILIIWSVGSFPWGLPSLIAGLYVMLSTRATLLNWDPKAQSWG